MGMQPSDEGIVLVVGVDFSEGSAAAVREAVALLGRGLPGMLHAVHVLPDTEGHARNHPDEDAAMMKRAHRELRAFLISSGAATREEIDRAPSRVGLHVRLGNAGEELHRVAVQLDADMIVIGPHQGKLLKHRAMGGQARHIVERAHCPVLVARPKDFSTLEREPEIEPPCPRCVAARHQSGGATWWCEEHARPHEPMHVYSVTEDIPWAEHDSEVAATGRRIF